MKMDKRKAAFRQAISCLPPVRRAQMERLDGQEDIEELRFRAGQPPSAKTAAGEQQLPLEAVTSAELREILSRAAQYSVHSCTDSLRHGFVTLTGGHRLGVCGTAAEEDGHILGVRGLSSLNLRIAHQAEDLQAHIARWVGEDEPQSVLLISPPGYGKTTLLREWVRWFSDRGFTAAIADERSEIAALADGVPQLAVGRCTDVMEGCSKRQAAVMLLKTMSPALLALDEITAPEDAEAVSLCTHCGTAVAACAHAAGLDDLRQRPLYRELLALGAFHQAVIIEKQGGQRIYRMERWEESEC